MTWDNGLVGELMQAMGGDRWRPIETAPKDGTEVLVYCSGFYVSSFTSGSWYDPGAPEFDILGTGLEPTHWMPLPAPPEPPSPTSV